MHPALAIPELLETIFGHLDKASNAKNILVCRKWYDIGKRVLWHDIDGRLDFHRLVKILGPLGYINPEEGGEIDFDTYPGVGDWARFEKYAKLVRTMSLRDLHGYSYILAILSEARPMLNMFPNVHTLEYAMADFPSTCVLFMHPTVVRFKMIIPVLLPTPPRPSWLFELLFILESIPRMTMLTHINIDGPLDLFTDLLGRTLDAICGLTSLQSIRFPRYSMTPQVFEKLAHLPRLEELGTQEQFIKTTKASVPLKPILPPGSFPALRAVTVSTDLSSARQFLINHAFVSKIRRLSLELDDFDAGSLPSLLKAVAQTCKAMQTLLINKRMFVLDGLPLEPLPSFTLDALTPIVSCPHLTSLEINHHACSPDFTEADLDVFAAQVPHIEFLVLNTSSYIAPPKLTLRALPILATRCPRLKTLGLCLDTSDTFALQQDFPPPGGEFRALERLALERSRIRDNAHAVAFFLAQICPPGCELEAAAFDTDERWQHVRVLLPSLVKMRVVTTRRVEERLRAGASKP